MTSDWLEVAFWVAETVAEREGVEQIADQPMEAEIAGEWKEGENLGSQGSNWKTFAKSESSAFSEIPAI